MVENKREMTVFLLLGNSCLPFFYFSANCAVKITATGHIFQLAINY